MITYEQALEDILKNTRTLPDEKIPIGESIGRILKEDIISGVEMPPFNRSAMDGYALNHLDIKKIPVKLKGVGLIKAGDVFKKKLKRGECVKIMTGAALPEHADCVVMVEYTRLSAGMVEVLRAAQKGENVFFRGEDFGRGQKVLDSGTRISSSHIPIFVTLGKKFIKVTGKPKVAILNTGSEIVQLGHKLSRNKIYNSNGPMLEALFRSDGFEPVVLGVAKDNKEELKKMIIGGFGGDILLISGGVSVGDYDLVPDALKELGVKKVFHKVNIKPGKPVFFGIKGKTFIFGIPGNPISNFVAYFIFVMPAIQKMMGYQDYGFGFKEGVLESEFHKKAGRCHFVLVSVAKKKNRYFLSPVAGHSSADTLSLAKADGFMMVDVRVTIVKNKERVKFITWKEI